jgi:hypothetical protein
MTLTSDLVEGLQLGIDKVVGVDVRDRFDLHVWFVRLTESNSQSDTDLSTLRFHTLPFVYSGS